MAESFIIGGYIALQAVIAAKKRKIESILLDIDRKNKVFSSSYHFPEKKQYAFLLSYAAEHSIEITYLKKEPFAKLTKGQNYGGIAALAGMTASRTAKELLEKTVKKGFYLALEGVEDPFNVGQIFRAAYALGVDGVFMQKREFPSKAAEILIRSSAGTSELLDTAFYETPLELTEALQNAGVELVCAAKRKDAIALENIKIKAPFCLVIGGERRGVSRLFLKRAQHTVAIEYRRPGDLSLSAVSASSILLYELGKMLFT